MSAKMAWPVDLISLSFLENVPGDQEGSIDQTNSYCTIKSNFARRNPNLTQPNHSAE